MVIGPWSDLSEKVLRKGSISSHSIILFYIYLHFMLDAHSQYLEKVLEGAELISLLEPAEGQICLIRLGSSRVRVVIDKIFTDGRLGVHGLDQVLKNQNSFKTC